MSSTNIIVGKELKNGSIEREINGHKVTLSFTKEPNPDAADFIKKILLNAYLQRVS